MNHLTPAAAEQSPLELQPIRDYPLADLQTNISDWFYRPPETVATDPNTQYMDHNFWSDPDAISDYMCQLYDRAATEGVAYFLTEHNQTDIGHKIGLVVLNVHAPQEEESKTAVVGLLIGDKSAQGKGYAKLAIAQLIERSAAAGFERYDAQIVSGNQRSERAFRSAGFAEDSTFLPLFLNDRPVNTFTYFPTDK